MIHPSSSRKKCWDAFVGFLLLWTAIFLPIRLAFWIDANRFLVMLELAVDLLFVVVREKEVNNELIIEILEMINTSIKAKR